MIVPPGRLSPVKVVAGLAIAVILGAGLIVAHLGDANLGLVEGLPGRVRDLGPLGWLIFVAAQIGVAVAGFVPASLLGMAAGVTYGIGLGFLLSSIGTMAGGLIAFGLARSLLRDWIVGRLRSGSRQVRLDAAIGREGWRLVCLLRVSPIMPFAVTSYALGLTSVSLCDYVIGTLASLPALFGYVTIGALTEIGLSGRGQGWIRVAVVAVGILATLALTMRLGRLLQATKMLQPVPEKDRSGLKPLEARPPGVVLR